MWIILVILSVSTLLLLLYANCMKPDNFPPGPRWYPILGSALAIYRLREKTGMLCEVIRLLSNQYTNNGVIGLKVGKDKVVIAYSGDAIRDMMNNEMLDGRPMGPFYETRTWGKRLGILLTDEDFWNEQRRFVVRHLKDFGFARRGMVEMIEKEAKHLLDDFQRKVNDNGGEVKIQMQDAFGVYILNTLWTMMAGKRYDHDNNEMKYLQQCLDRLFKNIDMMGAMFSHFPFLRFIAPDLSGYTEFIEIHTIMHSFIARELEQHKKRLKTQPESRDLMDIYLKMLDCPDKSESFSEQQLLAICLDMFFAGSETTTKSLRLAILYLVRQLDIQKKLQAEIDTVIGRDRLPILEDRAKMPYCEAIILESLRHFMGHTFGIPHRALRDTILRDYYIPKSSMVIACFGGMMYDEKCWPDAKTFRPERFLVNGKITLPQNYNPFGVGKHRCIGEMMARSNLFLFITTLFQNFSFLVPKNHPLPSNILLDGVTPSVRKYEALVVNRNNNLLS